jgi:citrate lyase subunit beta / citryl-CoA lyase
MLFVPGHKPAWVAKALAAGADAVILDLEDAVSAPQREQARSAVRDSIGQVAAGGTPCFVRVNGWGTRGALLADLTAVMRLGLSGVMLPKVTGPGDVIALAMLLTELEAMHHITDPVEIVPLCETAQAIDARRAVYAASARVRRAPVGVYGSPNGDAARSIGLIQTETGDETAYLLARAVLEARAAGLVGVLGGMSTSVRDLGDVERVARRSRRFGANGALAIHPAHVAILHDVYTPSRTEVEEAAGLVRLFADQLAAGEAAAVITYQGRMVDIAHLRSAVDLLDDAVAWRLDVPASASKALTAVVTWLEEQ